MNLTASGTTFRVVPAKIGSEIPVPLPPLSEQRRIVAKVDELLSLCDQLEAQQQEQTVLHPKLGRAALVVSPAPRGQACPPQRAA